MKKIIFRISLILILIIGVLTNISNADSIAGVQIIASPVQTGETFKVKLILPSNTHVAQAIIKVTYADGTSSEQQLTYLHGDTTHSNEVTFTAGAPGKATVNAYDIVIADFESNELEGNGSKIETLTVTEKTSKPENSSNTVNTNTTQNKPATNTSTTNTTVNNNNSVTSNTINNTNTTSNTSNVKFSQVNETVYTTKVCNVRKNYSTNSDKVATLKAGATLKRTGIGENGWSKVEYNGQVAYIFSEYLTTTEPKEEEPEFTDVNETMYAKQDCNVRKSWTTESDKAGYLLLGQEVKRTGVGNNGWSRIEYEGKNAYVATRLLTDKKIEQVEEPENKVVENAVKNTLTKEEKLKIIKEEVGVLPEVGNNIAEKFYIIAVIIAVLVTTLGYYYINKKEIN